MHVTVNLRMNVSTGYSDLFLWRSAILKPCNVPNIAHYNVRNMVQATHAPPFSFDHVYTIGEKYELWSSSFYSFPQPALTFAFLVPNILKHPQCVNALAQRPVYHTHTYTYIYIYTA
jgi:hypothetical protein